MGVLLALLGAAAFSVMNVAIRKGVREGDGDNGVLTTVVINVVAFTVLVAVLVGINGVASWSWVGFWAFVAAGLSSTFLGRTMLFSGIRRIGAARASAIKNATPLVTLAIALTILGERLTPLAAGGILLVLLGIALIVRESIHRAPRLDIATSFQEDPVDLAIESEALAGGGTVETLRGFADRTVTYVAGGMRRQALIGVALAGLAAVSFGTGHALRRVGMDILPDAVLGAMIGSWAALIAYGAAAVLRGQASAIRSTLTARRPYFWVAGLGGTVGQICFFAALLFAPVSHVSVVASSETVLTIFFSGLVAQRVEQVTRRLVLPATLVFGGAVIIALAR
jgi:drug/metabolite transporter (DMT)-like permease